MAKDAVHIKYFIDFNVSVRILAENQSQKFVDRKGNDWNSSLLLEILN